MHILIFCWHGATFAISMSTLSCCSYLNHQHITQSNKKDKRQNVMNIKGFYLIFLKIFSAF